MSHRLPWLGQDAVAETAGLLPIWCACHRHSMILRKQGLQALLSQRQQHSADGKAEADILVLLASLSRQLGDARDTVGLVQQAIARCPHMVVSSHLLEESLGLAYADLGERTKRKDLLERALKINMARHGERHSIVASIMDNLGWLHVNLGDHAQARDLAESALKIKEAHYGKEHFEVAETLNNLAVAVGELGDHTRERDLLEEALKIEEAHYGKQHFEVANTLNNLAMAYGNLGDHTRERDLLEEALKIKEAPLWQGALRGGHNTEEPHRGVWQAW